MPGIRDTALLGIPLREVLHRHHDTRSVFGDISDRIRRVIDDDDADCVLLAIMMKVIRGLGLPGFSDRCIGTLSTIVGIDGLPSIMGINVMPNILGITSAAKDL
jgi:hypothetical protein